jgi:hypothetical protein
MKYAVEMVSDGMICITSFRKTGTDVHKLLGMGGRYAYRQTRTSTHTHTHTHTQGQQGDLISLL